MSTIHDDNATTWRDLADQLTPQQVEGLERAERRYADGGIGEHPETTAALLGFAREYAQTNLTDAAYADVPLPAGASTDSESWGQDLQNGGYRRSLQWRTFGDPTEINVGIDGWQSTDGSFTRYISLWGVEEGGPLTAAQARRVAAMLVQAADAFEALQ